MAISLSVKFSVDSKDRGMDVADSTLMTSDAFQDASGAPLPLCMLITERKEQGGRVEYSAVNMGFYGRYGRIGPGGSNASGTHVPSTYSATIADYDGSGLGPGHILFPDFRESKKRRENEKGKKR